MDKTCPIISCYVAVNSRFHVILRTLRRHACLFDSMQYVYRVGLVVNQLVTCRYTVFVMFIEQAQ